MFFITVKRKTLGLVALVIILCLAVVSVYGIVKVIQNENKYQSILVMAQKFENTNFLAYISDEEAKNEILSIEVFDIAKEEVISKTAVTPDIQNEVYNYIKAIKGLYTKVIPLPEKGYVIRIPFDPTINIRIKHLNDVGIKSLKEVFVIVSDKEAPLLLVLDSQRKPYFYIFNGSVQPLLDYVKLKPEAKSMEEPDGTETYDTTPNSN